MEFILTFILMLVIFMMASNKKNKPFLGIVVGLVVGLEAIFAEIGKANLIKEGEDLTIVTYERSN